MAISSLDWWVIGLYLVALLAMAAFLSRSQKNREDYYVGGRSLSKWPVAVSIMATQCSTNSILGAPAFVAFTAGGGLLWLQYELAVPLAMAVLIIFFVPVFRGLNLVSIYDFLERRFDLSTRLLLSALFMFIRAFATAVTVYSIAIVVDLITGIGFLWSVIILGVFTAVYDAMGGIKGVIYSDVLQMVILLGMLILVAWLLISDAGGLSQLWQAFSPERRAPLDFAHFGINDGQSFSFWPMLLGGFFLYVSYYGCDQSQTQRILSTQTVRGSQSALLLNGLLRFPVVFTYCMVGVGIAVFAANTPGFMESLALGGDVANVNLAVPVYMMSQLHPGLVGLALVALFAAAMSSLDSVLSSLSATSMEDFVRRLGPQALTIKKELWISRGLTIFWGALTLALTFTVDDIAPTVLEAINKIGSLVNGPILAVFVLGLLTRRCSGLGAKIGLLAGFFVNLGLWLYLQELSWLWWNVIGFFLSFALAMAVSFMVPHAGVSAPGKLISVALSKVTPQSKSMVMVLVGYFVAILLFLLYLNSLA